MDGDMSVGGASSSHPVQETHKTAPTKTTVTTKQQKSSISPAEQETKHSKDPAMAAPMLAPPLIPINEIGNFITIAGATVAAAGVSKNLNSNDFVAAVQVQMLQITNDALSKWVQSIQDISAQNTKTQAQKRTNEIESDKTKDTQKAEEENGEKARAVGIQTLVFSGLLAAGLVPGVATVSATTMATITQAIAAIAPAGLQALPAAFITLAGAMASGAVMQASLQTIFSGAKSKDKKAIDAEFVKNYSAKILGTINDSSFTSTLSKLFPDKADLIPTAKLILLATAIGLSYKAETGHMIGLDFLNLVNGLVTLPPNDPRLGLIAAFQATLAGMKNGDQMKQKLAAYFDSNPSLDSLLEPSEALAGMVGPGISPISNA